MGATHLIRYTIVSQGRKFMIQPAKGSRWSLSTARAQLGSYPDAFLAAAHAAEVSAEKYNVDADEATRLGDLSKWMKSPFMSVNMRPGK